MPVTATELPVTATELAIESAVKSLCLLFLNEATSLFDDHRLKMINEVWPDPDDRDEELRGLMNIAIYEWMEGLADVARDYGEKLTNIAARQALGILGDDPALWVRETLSKMVSKHLLETRLPQHPNDTLVGVWFKLTKRPRTDELEPWVASAWCEQDDLILSKWREKGQVPDKLTRSETLDLIKRTEDIFTLHLKMILEGEIEPKARAALGTCALGLATTFVKTGIATAPPPAGTSAPPNGTAKLIQWNGTDRSLADTILKQYADGQIVAASPTEALRKGSERYVRKDGTHFKPRSLWQNIKNREAEGK